MNISIIIFLEEMCDHDPCNPHAKATTSMLKKNIYNHNVCLSQLLV
jgi:hypothetical protein